MAFHLRPSRRAFCRTLGAGALWLTAGCPVSAAPSTPRTVIVVGSGAAGLTAAVAAAEVPGTRVILLEKLPLLGGHTAIASGSVNVVLTDDRLGPDVHRENLSHWLRDTIRAGAFAGDLRLVQTLVTRAESTYKWLTSHGVEFRDEQFQAWGAAYPRTRRLSGSRGTALVRTLARRARSAGVDIRMKTALTGLLTDAAGGVTGVSIRTPDGSPAELSADAVILATGGFTANIAMRMEYDRRLDATLNETANPEKRLLDGSTGEGIRFAESIGALTTDMEATELIPFLGGRLLDYVGGDIFVNSQGQRFVNEGAPALEQKEAFLNLPDRVMWAITDSQSHKNDYFGRKLVTGAVRTAPTIEAMAEAMHVPVQALRDTIDTYNRDVADGTDTAFGKKQLLQPISKPPFYFGLESFDIHYSCGGLRIDERARVLRAGAADGTAPVPVPIRGLYAAGECTGGIDGKERLGGNALTEAFVFGLIAGREAAGVRN